MRPMFFAVALVALATGALGAPWHSLTSHKYSQRECMTCRFSVSLVNYALRTNRGADQVHRIANSFCALAHIESPPVCDSVTKLFKDEVTKVIAHGVLTPNQVCGILSNNTCGTFHNPMADWEVNLNVSASLDLGAIARMRRIRDQLKTPQKPHRVIHISDTHIDYKYMEGSPSDCVEPMCCRNSSNARAGTKSAAGRWGSYERCDVPPRTLESALRMLNETMDANGDIEYIVWTGDIQPHDVWEQSKEGARETYSQVFSTIFKYLPSAKIFPTLGNHEMVPVDSFSPSNLLSVAREDSPEWLYKEVDSYWSRWLPEDTIKTITKDGFYSVVVRTGLKIISLNTNFCHTNNFWLFINSTDPGDQLQWLIHELQISELIHEQVHIIGHIPPGADDCLRVWSKNFNRIVRRFSKTIGGQFYGHTHTGEFEVFYNNVDVKLDDKTGDNALANGTPPGVSDPISVAFVAPSITTFIGVNPSFRIYTIDPNQGYMPTNFETYYMNLTAANAGAAETWPTWKSAGLFSDMFGLNDTSPSALHQLLLDIVNELKIEDSYNRVQLNHDGELEQETESSTAISLDGSGDSGESKLFKLYQIFNSYSDMFNQAEFDKILRDKKKEFVCRFFSGESHAPEICDHFFLTVSGV